MARLAVVPELDAELARLYELPLEEFTPARNDLAARLKRAGRDDAAAQVKALRKPSIPVWTVNQLARRHPDAVGQLLDAGGRLRTAQEAALRGASGDDVRSATRDERDALRALTRLAEELLSGQDRPVTAQTLERVSATLRAAAVDPDAAKLVAAGRLPDEPESPGFAAVAAIAPPPSEARRTARPKTDAAAKREHDQRVRKLRRDAESAERAAAEAEAEVEHAARAVAAARERAKQARRAARDAAKALAAEERRGA